MTLIFKQKELEYNTKEYNKQYQTNLKFWSKLRNNEIELNDQTLKEMILNKCDFWVNLENDKPYNKKDCILLSMSFSYIGTNKFYGYLSKEYFQYIKNLSEKGGE